MSAKVICMASSKGGSGKTLLTTTFGTFIAALDRKVLLIDTDAATNGLTLLHLKEVLTHAEVALGRGTRASGIYDGFRSESAEVVALSRGYDLIPAAFDFVNSEDVAPDAYSARLADILNKVREKYDYIFLDAQAGADAYAQIAMSRGFSDEVVIVSEYDPMSAAGVERLKGLLRDDLTYGRAWVLLNKMLPDFVQSFSDFLEVAKYLSPIPWEADVVRAYARRRVALDLDAPNEHTLAVMQTLRGLFGEELEADLDAWAEKHMVAIRKPIDQQYSDLKTELAGLRDYRNLVLHQYLRINRTQRVSKVAWTSAAILLYVGITTFVGFNETVWTRQIAYFAVLVPLVLFAVVLFYRAWRLPVASMQRESDIASRIADLESRLYTLDQLRNADFSTLVKHRKAPGTNLQSSGDDPATRLRNRRS